MLVVHTLVELNGVTFATMMRMKMIVMVAMAVRIIKMIVAHNWT